AYTGDNSPSCLGSESCAQWVLKYKKESSGEIASIESKNHVHIASSGSANLTINTVGFSQVALVWTAVPNASSYIVERSSSSSFTSSVSSEFSDTSGSMTGLTTGQTYYFR